MKRIKLFLVLICSLLAGSLWAQSVKVSGVILEAETGEPVPYASVMIKGTTTGVSADGDGKYSITANQGQTLVFSAIGYISFETQVGPATVNVELDLDAQALDNSVVVGYGTKKNVSSLVGSVKVVDNETIKNAPSSSVLDNLQGQVAGLSVMTSSGVAGDDAVSMTLHGVGSLSTDTSPLFIIDGVPSTSRAIMAMNPNDIETVSVLKDASATSIYGSRAANGVVYITTKTGGFNERATVSVRAQYGVSTLASTRLYQNMMSSDELCDFWVRSGIHTQEWINENYINQGYNANTQWYKYMMNLWTPQYQADVTISGGSAKVAYMMSASQFHQDGFTIGNYYDRYTVRSNVQAHPRNWLKTGINMNLSLDKNQQNANWGSSSENSNYVTGGLSYLLNPLYSPYDENGNEYTYKIAGLNMTNPYYYMEAIPDVVSRYGLNGSVFVEITPIRNLTISSRLGVDANLSNETQMLYASVQNTLGYTPFVYEYSGLRYQATITNTIEYIWDLNHNHKFTFLVGQEGIDYDVKYFYAYSYGQSDDRMMLLQNGTQDTYGMYEYEAQYRFLSFFAHVDYTLFNRYFFDVVIRNDASSRFGANHRNAQFWSVGGKWNVKRESFLRNVRDVNALDFKLSYGTQGNAEIGNYASLCIIGSYGTYADVTGLNLTQASNENLTWEKQGLFTVGVSGAFFNNILDVEAEVYNRKTTSMLMDVPNPYTTGFSSVTQNVGSLSNTGLDLTLGVNILRAKDYYLRASATFAYNRQKVTELFDGRDSWIMSSALICYQVGSPVNFYMPIYAGIDPEDGQQMWYVPGDDTSVTTMTETTKTFDFDALSQNTGKSMYAPVNGGFGISAGWKGLSLQVNFAYVLGKYLWNNDGYFYLNPNQFSTYNTHKEVSDFWTPTNTDAKYPDWGSGAIMQQDTHLLENASFLRLKNLQIGYALPERTLNWSNGVLKGVKITFTGRNLLTATNYSGLDPEVDSNLTYGTAGNSRQFLGGIEITF